MEYTDGELDVLQQEAYLRELEQDEFHFAAGSMKSASLKDLQASDNPENFQEIDYLISKGESLQMEFGIDDGLPYYKVQISPDRKVILYLNKEIIHYLYSWIKDGVKLPNAPNTWDVQKNASERYMLHLLKRDGDTLLDGKPVLQAVRGFRSYDAKYPNGTIHYETPYLPDELLAKLDQIS